MKTAHFTVQFSTQQSPQQVFKRLCDVRSWWSGYFSEQFEGPTSQLHDVFEFRAGDGAHYSKHELTEVVPGKRIVWLVTDSHFNFIEQPNEWTGTRVLFDIAEENDKTLFTFTHEGLTPAIECYTACAPAWIQYLENKLAPLLEATIHAATN